MGRRRRRGCRSDPVPGYGQADRRYPKPGQRDLGALGRSVCRGHGRLAVAAAGPFARYRASLLALAAAICFALLALLTKTFTYLVSQGVSLALTSWQTYALIGIGIVGFLSSPSAYQAGSLESSLPIIDTVEPTVAVLLGVLGFNEHVQLDAVALFSQALGGFLAVGGVFVLGRSALLVRAYGGSEEPHDTVDTPRDTGPEGTEPSRA